MFWFCVLSTDYDLMGTIDVGALWARSEFASQVALSFEMLEILFMFCFSFRHLSIGKRLN